MSGPRLGHVKYVAVLNQLMLPPPLDNWIPPFDNWIPTGMHILSHIHLEYDLLLHISIPHRYKSVYD
jgi:hypothetical protein